MSNSTLAFEPSCPSGGDWYACGNGAKFVGCCTVNPCNDNGCAQGNLRSASFLASAYGTFPDQECSAGSWYTCAGTNPPFLGCCSVNPCSAGCPDTNLRAGFLSNNPTSANAFDPDPPLPSSQNSTSSTPTPSSTQIPASSKLNSTSAGTIAGAVVGGVIGILLIVLAIFFILRRHRRSNRDQLLQPYHQPGNIWGGLSYSDNSPHLNDRKHPPSYTSQPYSGYQSPNFHSPVQPQEIHEAGSREVSYLGSPLQSPVLTSDTRSSMNTAAGLGVRSVQGNSEDMRAELYEGNNERH